MSVVKNGLPVPAASTTTRPFSRWRRARARMNGSATERISRADMTRAGKPIDSSLSFRARALMMVPSMPM